jgi:hypothetical protein
MIRAARSWLVQNLDFREPVLSFLKCKHKNSFVFAPLSEFSESGFSPIVALPRNL